MDFDHSPQTNWMAAVKMLKPPQIEILLAETGFEFDLSMMVAVVLESFVDFEASSWVEDEVSFVSGNCLDKNLDS